MSAINLHHLRIFCSVATSGGIRVSAELLFRAPSAVARAVAVLEEQLGVALFERKGRGMLLTNAGDTVLARALRIEGELNAVREEALKLGGQDGERVGSIDALFNGTRLMCASLLAQVHHMPSVARTIGLSQPAVSAAIGKLEGSLRQPLFLRTARGMTPTELGVRWIMRFDRALAELNHIASDVSALKGTLEGLVTVGALPLARTLMLPTAIAALLKRYPRLQVRSLESPYEELCRGLLSGRVDFILGALRPAVDKELVTELLFGEPIVLICRSGHPLVGKQNLTFEDIGTFPWVLSRAGTPLRDSLDAFFVRSGQTPPRPAVETGDLALLRGMLLQSDMLTTLSAQQLYYEIDAGNLTVLPFVMEGMQRKIGVTTRSGARLSPGAVALLAEVRKLSRVLGNSAAHAGSCHPASPDIRHK